MNMSHFILDATLAEGKKRSVSIAQVGEIVRIVFILLSRLDPKERETAIMRYKGKKIYKI